MFGYKNMFRYKEREGLSFHDATYEPDRICDLYWFLLPQKLSNRKDRLRTLPRLKVQLKLHIFLLKENYRQSRPPLQGE